MALSLHLGSVSAPRAKRTLTLVHAGSPGGAALHLVRNPAGGGFYLACNNAGNANGVIEFDSGPPLVVLHNADPATNLGGVPLYAVEAKAGTGQVLRAAVQGDASLNLPLQDGLCLEIEDSAAPSSGTVALNYNVAASAGLKVLGTFAGAANITVTTSERFFAIVQGGV
jgi:hypothetical protein